MAKYIVRRVLGLIPVLFVASILIFLIIHLIPGDPMYTLLPPDPLPEQIEAIRSAYGLDRPLVQQYLIWLGRVARGDFGVSISSHWAVIINGKQFLIHVFAKFQKANFSQNIKMSKNSRLCKPGNSADFAEMQF